MVQNHHELFPAPLGGSFGNRFTCRASVILGGVLSFAGLVLSSFASNLVHLYICMGIITGNVSAGLSVRITIFLYSISHLTAGRGDRDALGGALITLPWLGRALQYQRMKWCYFYVEDLYTAMSSFFFSFLILM